MRQNLKNHWRISANLMYKSMIAYYVFVPCLLLTGEEQILEQEWVFRAVSVGMMAAAFAFMVGMSEFRILQSCQDRGAIKSLEYASWMALLCGVACLFSVYPALLYVGAGSQLLGCLMTISATAKLRRSATFPDSGVAGAQSLWLGALLSLGVWCVMWIPQIGTLLAFVGSFPVLFLMAKGWNMIRSVGNEE